MSRRFDAVLVDLGGVVYVGDEPIAGSVDALDRLKRAGIRLRFVTNTTRVGSPALQKRLERLGLDAEQEELFTPAKAALDHLRENDLAPHLLVHPALEAEFAGCSGSAGQALVVGDAGDAFTYGSLDDAFRVLDAGAEFLALARNRFFKDGDDQLHLDAGAFVAALEFATQRRATVLGKPSPEFFRAAVRSTGVPRERSVMIGDDPESDIDGAFNAGLAGILVQTGKYRPGDESRMSRPPDFMARDLSGAVDWILAKA